MERLRILFYGAGVIGSLYAARLAAAHDVTVLARGQRLQSIRDNGIMLVNEDNQECEQYPVRAIDHLKENDRYDYILVSVRCTQCPGVLPVLQANCSDNIVFFMNGVTSYDNWHNALGERLLSGFPMAGGEIRDGVVHYASGTVKGKKLAAYLGTPDGRDTPALQKLKQAFESCGLAVEVPGPMRSFHFYHAALVTPIANALYKCAGSNYTLAKNSRILRKMLASVRECFRALSKKGLNPAPSRLRMINAVPLWLAVPFASRVIGTQHMETVAAQHARNARDEMERLGKELMDFIEEPGTNLSNTRELAKYI